MKCFSWGRLQAFEHQGLVLSDRRQASTVVASALQPGLPFGMGRSYGDVCLNPGGALWITQGLDRYLDFDEQTGRLTCEAGVLLDDIQRTFLPRGWMLPVTPGTRYVTVGGAVANDVHGKNHHRMGTLGSHVLGLTLLRTTGEALVCTPDSHADWLSATVGGMGLTGLIQSVTLQLRRVPGAWLRTDMATFDHLLDFFNLADASEAGWEYTVSWIDCLAGGSGRGVFMRANHEQVTAAAQVLAARSRRLPFTPPISLVNRVSLRAFNTLYFHANKWKQGERLQHCESFFYPLDHIRDWNLMYGPRGFYQYQCVLPGAAGREAVRTMLDEIARSGQGSFLAVLKTFGAQASRGMLSFPMPGVTLALDFPNRGESTTRLFDRLDRVVHEVGGRLYMAKDARMPRWLFEAGYPRIQEFLAYRDPGISSAMSRRLMGQ